MYIVEMESIGLQLESTSHVALEHHFEIPNIYAVIYLDLRTPKDPDMS